ncbi:MAG: DUF1566 domain-containing protein [Spirochaetes bacterium]|nr:DUF1566 domain-containing protein [Spirochaetota bacterium]
MLLVGCPVLLDLLATTTTTTVTPATTTTTTTTTTIPTYTFAYNGNGNTGGSVPKTPEQHTTGDSVIVLDNNLNLAKAGYLYFTGWNTQTDGSGSTMTIGSYFTIGTANVTLYAQYGNIPPIGAVGPAGGNVFYDKGFYSNGWRYLEAAPYSTEAMKAWWIGRGETLGATGAAIGTGKANTDTIVAATGSSGSAAQYCADLVYGGFDDWFLPSIDELALIYHNLKLNYKGNYSNYYYWSSTEMDQYDAYIYNFYSGSVHESNKVNGDDPSDRISVRAVRAY